MDWYCALIENLLGTENTIVRDTPFKSSLQQLEQKVVALYKAILLYQLKSVCSYYKNQGVVFLRNLANLDTWDDDLSSVKTAEKELLDDWITYDRSKASKLSDELVKIAKEMENRLGDIHQTLWDFTNQQMKMRTKDENNKCLRDLRVVNPHKTSRQSKTKRADYSTMRINGYLQTPNTKSSLIGMMMT
jgi:hypothetical protein